MFKPELTTLEASHRLALREGQKRDRTEIESRAERERKGDEKMRKLVKASILLMAILTVIYTGLVVYANANSSYDVGSSGDGKEPIEYDIWRAYFAEKLETEPQEWNTTEELGIIFDRKMEYAETETYLLLIIDEEKAFPWMRDDEFTPYAVKYEDEFYHIVFLWVSPGLPEHVRQCQIPTGIALGAGWVFTGVHFLKGRKAETTQADGYYSLQ